MNLLNGIWKHHLLSNKVGQNSRPLDTIHFKFSAICVRFMYKYLTQLVLYFLHFLIRRLLSFLKTFLVITFMQTPIKSFVFCHSLFRGETKTLTIPRSNFTLWASYKIWFKLSYPPELLWNMYVPLPSSTGLWLKQEHNNKDTYIYGGLYY